MMAARGCQRDAAWHPRGDSPTGNLPGHGPAASVGLMLATSLLLLLEREILTFHPV